MKWQLLDRKQSGGERGDGIGKGRCAGTVRNGAICRHATNIFPFLYRRRSYIQDYFSIQDYLYNAFYDTIVAKQLHRKLSF